MDLSTWITVTTTLTAALSAVAATHAISGRAKVRAFYDIAHENVDGEWVPLGVTIHVANVGRSAALLRSAGVKSASRDVTRTVQWPEKLRGEFTEGRSPMILRPGEMVTYFVGETLLDSAEPSLGVVVWLSWRFSRLAQRLPARVLRSLPNWTKERWHRAVGPKIGGDATSDDVSSPPV